MSDDELPEFMIDDDEETPAEPEPERRLRDRFLHGYFSPTTRLSRLMLWSACSLRLRRDIDMHRTIVVVLEVSTGWLDPIYEAARALFGRANFVCTGNVGKTKGVTDLDLRSSVSTGQSLVIVSSQGLDGISPAIQASIDHRVRIPLPNRLLIAATIRATFGHKSIKGVPDLVGQRAPASALLAAIRPKENAARAIARLIDLDKRLQAPSGGNQPDGPSLADLSGYGEAKRWGLELASDLEGYRSGSIAWPELGAAAVLHGPPGTGKTYFASALARSCRVPMIATSLGDMFNNTSGYINNIVRQMSDAFDEARGKAPALLFIDELDSLPDRRALDSRSRDYWTTIVNHLLKLIDDKRDGVIVLGATNMLDRIDSALLRAGRLERHFEITLPGEAALAGMFRHYLGQRLPDADLLPIARLAIGSTGAQVTLHVKSATAKARRHGRDLVVQDLLDEFASDESPDLLRRVSVHEAGHAIVAFHFGRQVEHLSNRRNSASGAGVLFAALEDGATRPLLEEEIIISLAGRAAEMLVLGEASTGAGADLSRATKMLAAIHGSLGLGTSLVHFADPLIDTRLLSDPTFRDLIESELRILEARANVILNSRLAQVHAVADALNARRVLGGQEFLALVLP